MSAVRYADASGLAVLVSTQRRAVLLGGGLRLAAPSPEVAGLLIATGLSRHLAGLPHGAGCGGRPGAGQPHGSSLGRAAAMGVQTLPAQAQTEPGAESGELHAAVAGPPRQRRRLA